MCYDGYFSCVSIMLGIISDWEFNWKLVQIICKYYTKYYTGIKHLQVWSVCKENEKGDQNQIPEGSRYR